MVSAGRDLFARATGDMSGKDLIQGLIGLAKDRKEKREKQVRDRKMI